MGFPCQYFDGKSSECRTGQLSVGPDGSLVVRTERGVRTFLKHQYTVISRVANLPITIELEEGRLIRVPITPEAVLALTPLAKQEFKLLHAIETSYKKILACCIAAGLVLWICYTVVIPFTARLIAPAIPYSVKLALRDQILLLLDKAMLSPSTLSDDEQARVAAITRSLRPVDAAPIEIFVRRMGAAPNAFALPPNTIIFTDAIVKELSEDELRAVAAHELGHLHYDHGMVNLVRSSLVTVIGTLAIEGAFGSDVIASLAAGFLDAQYSQAQELAADDFATTTLRERSLSPLALASALEKITHDVPESKESDFLSSHPSTGERVRRIREQSPDRSAAK